MSQLQFEYIHLLFVELYKKKFIVSYKIFQDIKIKYKEQVKYKNADFFGMWKLAFQDKMDQGNRIPELLGELATTDNGLQVFSIYIIVTKYITFHIIFLRQFLKYILYEAEKYYKYICY